ncbi:hypothetical protein IU433_25710 [Nocardia puris]|uniref:Uncharacterized protein n=1 Tax=Nocardia puris TaxID=208602 RepID=A0A366E3N9_9NOCA|nr:DUF6086 family protein [Nocardia puris]MBF6214694.1 hypothetical protein [Nocardia puris]MBF6368832.1 hypothetical protein [Nocardia puris]MBF6462412.1 hypothetical protein [Nocardia puris]RBO96990.1 hypothetical protein DFR74_1011009 [Nocardia puris]
MSYVFDVGGETVWSPALRVGDLYVRAALNIADVLGVPSGLTAEAEDLWQIDIDAFEGLITAVREVYFTRHHEIQRALLAGVLGPAIVMLDRAGRPIEPRSTAERDFAAWARTLSMPR